jgi:hypothetical protein
MEKEAAAGHEVSPVQHEDNYESKEANYPVGDHHVAFPNQGWKYKQRKLLGFTFPWYASPSVQLTMVAFVCFLCPGMFNALGGLGGGGKADATLADDMVSSLLHFFTFQPPNQIAARVLESQCCGD